MGKKYSLEYFREMTLRAIRKDFFDQYMTTDAKGRNELHKTFDGCLVDYDENDSFDTLFSKWVNELEDAHNSRNHEYFDHNEYSIDYKSWYIDCFESDEEREEREHAFDDVRCVTFDVHARFSADIRLTQDESDEFSNSDTLPSIHALDSIEDEINDLLKRHGFYDAFTFLDVDSSSYDLSDDVHEVFVSDNMMEASK